MPAVNPFKPTAGASPPLLIGRGAMLDEIAESIENGPGAPARLALVTGSRGVGKTVSLNAISALAATDGWQTLAETATPGLTTRLRGAAIVARTNLDASPRPRRPVTGVTLPSVLGSGGGGMTLAPPPASEPPDVRQPLEALLDVLEPHDAGLLITVDEVHRAARADLREFAAVIQHLIRDDRNIAVVLAGLPSAVSDLLNDDVLTFLRRASPFDLVDVPVDEVAAAFAVTITDSGYRVDDDALDLMAEATRGYPFMIQLVGYHVWRKAGDGLIDKAAAAAGIDAARRRLGATVHAAALHDLSDVDRTFLVAMADVGDPAPIGLIAERMGVTGRYANVYRNRLIDAQLIEPAGYGRVRFTLPYLREYLLEHAAQLALRSASGQIGPAPAAS